MTDVQRRDGIRGSERVVTLVDGARLLVRPIRTADGERLLRGFERLSPESRYRRFLCAMPELTPELVHYLTHVDHRDHEALVAIDPLTGEGVGVARFVRCQDEPGSAEVAVAVVDDWHQRGVATALLALLIDRARAVGVRRFTGTVLAENRPLLDLLREFRGVHLRRLDGSTVELALDLPEQGLGAHLPALLRAAANGQVLLRPPSVD